MRRASMISILILLTGALACLSACSPKAGDTSEASESAAVSAGDKAEVHEQAINATEEHVRHIGRTYVQDDVAWLPLSGSAIEFTANGTRLVLEIEGDDSVDNKESLRPRFAVLVDGEVVLDDTLSEKKREVKVFDDDSPRTATVEVIHLSEALQGKVGVGSITIDSAATNPIEPTPSRDFSIEFIGDSITCGYGVEGTNAEEPFSTKTENFMKSYAYLAARALEADYSAVCYSGYGVLSGWSANGERNEKMLLPPLYGLVAEGVEQPWDFATHTYDVVVINLGTNDTTYTGSNEGRMEEFERAYTEFLTTVRKHNPQSYIICTMGTMGGEELYPYIEHAVETFKQEAGDDRVMSYLSDPIDVEKDGSGANGHPNVISQQKAADQLVSVIRG